MNIVDALVVVLGLDSKELESKTPGAVKKLDALEKKGEATEKSVGKISKTSKETARSVENLSRTVTSFLAVIGGTLAIKNFVQDFIDANAQLDRLSKNLGINVATISAWSNASEKLGGSAQGLQGTFDMLSKAQTQLMITGESSLVPYLSALGISLAGVNGQARPVTDILLDLADRFSHMDRTTANNLGRMLGIDQGTMNLLLQGRKELELEIKRQKEQTAVTAQQAAQAQKFQTQIIGLKQQFAALGRSLLMDAAPYIEKLLILFERFGSWAQEHQQFIEDFLKVLAVGLGAIALVTAPINLTVAALVALAGAIALLWDDYQTWKQGGDSLIDWSKWEPGIAATVKGVRELISVIDALFDKFNNSWWKKITGSTWSNDFGAGWQVIKDALGIAPAGYKNPNAPKSSSTMTAAAIRDYFVKQGWTRAQAAGIAANLVGESGGNANAVGDNGAAYGLAQWHGDRQAAFRAFAGKDIRNATPMEQLAFVQYELTRGSEMSAGNALRKATNERDSASVIARQYERPADAALRASQRGDYAVALNSMPSGAGGNTSVDRSVKTTIGTVVVNTQAKDVDSMVADMNRAFDYLFVSQANYGMN